MYLFKYYRSKKDYDNKAFLSSPCFSRREGSCCVGMSAPGLSFLVQNLGNGPVFPTKIVIVRE